MSACLQLIERCIECFVGGEQCFSWEAGCEQIPPLMKNIEEAPRVAVTGGADGYFEGTPLILNYESSSPHTLVC